MQKDELFASHLTSRRNRLRLRIKLVLAFESILKAKQHAGVSRFLNMALPCEWLLHLVLAHNHSFQSFGYAMRVNALHDNFSQRSMLMAGICLIYVETTVDFVI